MGSVRVCNRLTSFCCSGALHTRPLWTQSATISSWLPRRPKTAAGTRCMSMRSTSSVTCSPYVLKMKCKGCKFERRRQSAANAGNWNGMPRGPNTEKGVSSSRESSASGGREKQESADCILHHRGGECSVPRPTKKRLGVVMKGADLVICSCEVSDRARAGQRYRPAIPLLSPLQFAFPLSSGAARASRSLDEAPAREQRQLAQFDKRPRCGTPSGRRARARTEERQQADTGIATRPTSARRSTVPTSWSP
jgi:hypothetical protein